MLRNTLIALTTTRLATAFEWKKGEDGAFVLSENGDPIWSVDGTDLTVGGDTISSLMGENKTRRTEVNNLKTQLKAFEGLDADAAREALTLAEKYKGKEMIDSGEFDAFKAQMTQQYQGQLDEALRGLADRDSRIEGLLRRSAFDGSKFVRENIAVPPEMFEAMFAKHLKSTPDGLIPVGRDGETIYSKKNMGKVASFDEAFQILVEASPYKDTLLKAPSASGSGNKGAGGSGAAGKRTISRAEFDALPGDQKLAAVEGMRSGDLKIVD